MKLPLLLSVPHGGVNVPPEVRDYCILTEEEIIVDGDEGASEIYWPLEEHVAAFIKTDIARAILDMNRREDERRADGVVKTETIYKVPIYCKPLPESIVNTLLESHHRPYHKSLVELAKTSGAILGIDCHTMAAKAPPIEADAGRERPPVCIGDAEGSLPAKWRDSLVRCFENVFKTLVTVNDPFSGGYITRTHAAELPWVQVELSRAPFMTNQQKSECVLTALHSWCEEHSGVVDRGTGPLINHP